MRFNIEVVKDYELPEIEVMSSNHPQSKQKKRGRSK